MTATLLDILMILALGVLAGTGTGLLIGFIARKQKRDWALMQKKDKISTILLILVCSATITAVLAWYVFWYTVM
jgi:fructose-specific phosphotransferase system IIC component